MVNTTVIMLKIIAIDSNINEQIKHLNVVNVGTFVEQIGKRHALIENFNG